MPPHIGLQLATLAALCDPDDKGTINGWSVDTWALDDEALEALSDLYEALLTGGLEEEIEAALNADGIDVSALLFDDDRARDMITRSDLTELTAAAAAIGVDDWPDDTLNLPNVPKGSRARSEVGVDALAVRMDFESEEVELEPNDTLFIGSVKHTIDDPGDCRYKLVKSVSPSDLTLPYVAQQLRVLSGRLEAQGFKPRRLYLLLRNFPDPEHVAITITGAVDLDLEDAFLDQMVNLPEVEGTRRCRHLLFDGLATLHELLNDD